MSRTSNGELLRMGVHGECKSYTYDDTPTQLGPFVRGVYEVAFEESNTRMGAQGDVDQDAPDGDTSRLYTLGSVRTFVVNSEDGASDGYFYVYNASSSDTVKLIVTSVSGAVLP